MYIFYIVYNLFQMIYIYIYIYINETSYSYDLIGLAFYPIHELVNRVFW